MKKPKGIRYQPSELNRKFLEDLQKYYKAKGGNKRGLSDIMDKLITEMRNVASNNDFHSRFK